MSTKPKRRTKLQRRAIFRARNLAAHAVTMIDALPKGLIGRHLGDQLDAIAGFLFDAVETLDDVEVTS